MNSVQVFQQSTNVSIEAETNLIEVTQSAAVEIQVDYAAPTSITIEPETNQIDITEPAAIDVQIVAIGIQGPKGDTGAAGVGSDEFKLQALQGYASDNLKEIDVDVSGNPLQIRVWNGAATILLLTQAFAYTLGDLSEIVYTNGRTNATLTKTFSYLNGNVNEIRTSGVQ